MKIKRKYFDLIFIILGIATVAIGYFIVYEHTLWIKIFLGILVVLTNILIVYRMIYHMKVDTDSINIITWILGIVLTDIFFILFFLNADQVDHILFDGVFGLGIMFIGFVEIISFSYSIYTKMKQQERKNEFD